MDKSLYVAMTGASATMRAQASVAHNLANANTVGFRATLNGTVAAPIEGDGHASRVAASSRTFGVSDAAGAVVNTGNPLDVALRPGHWLSVQDAQGGVAFTRAGDLQLTPNGILVTAAGDPVLDAQGAPLAIPPHERVEIAADGTVSIVPQGQPATDMAEVARLGVVASPTAALEHGEDGLMRQPAGAEPLPAAAGQVLTAGMVEGSNADATGALVSMIQLSRQFEMQVRLLHTADENARSSNSLISKG